MTGQLRDPQKILLAIDEHESSANAVEYVGRLVSACAGLHVTIMHVIEDPAEDFFETETEREIHLKEVTIRTEGFLEMARDRLIEHGLDADRISLKYPVKSCASMASCILEEAEENFGTLVVGRRGISKPEELVFGSVSKKLVEYARQCTVWVVQ